jgi:hypothetical protein
MILRAENSLTNGSVVEKKPCSTPTKLAFDSDDDPVFENLVIEENFIGKIILNGRSWLFLQLQRV